MKQLVIPLALASVLACMPVRALAAECYQGYDSTRCLALARDLQRKLDELYLTEEQAVHRTLKEFEQEFKDEVSRSLRATNVAYAAYRDSNCYTVPLRDGMSIKDSAVLADQCRVNWRQQRVAELRKRRAPSK